MTIFVYAIAYLLTGMLAFLFVLILDDSIGDMSSLWIIIWPIFVGTVMLYKFIEACVNGVAHLQNNIATIAGMRDFFHRETR